MHVHVQSPAMYRMYVCVCVCERERERERVVAVCVCVCVCERSVVVECCGICDRQNMFTLKDDLSHDINPSRYQPKHYYDYVTPYVYVCNASHMSVKAKFLLIDWVDLFLMWCSAVYPQNQAKCPLHCYHVYILTQCGRIQYLVIILYFKV